MIATPPVADLAVAAPEPPVDEPLSAVDEQPPVADESSRAVDELSPTVDESTPTADVDEPMPTVDEPLPSRDGDGAVPVETETPERVAAPLVDTRGSEPSEGVAEEPAPPVTEESTAEEESSDEDLAETAEEPAPEEEAIPTHQAWWMLSLFTPNATDQVDWARGKYTLMVRSGRVESAARHGDLKTPANMIQEGSVLVADAEPRGSAHNVAPESFPHPVYRAGFAVAIPIPLRVTP